MRLQSMVVLPPVPFSRKSCCNRSEGSELFRVGSRVLRDAMRRRDFIRVIVGMAAAWPIAARAQSKVARIGALYIGLADAESFKKELREGFRELGYVEGQNITLSFALRKESWNDCPNLRLRWSGSRSM